MEESIIKMAIEQGGYALISVILILWMIKYNNARELKYQETIEKNQEVIVEQAKAFASLSKDVSEIKQILVEDKGGKNERN